METATTYNNIDTDWKKPLPFIIYDGKKLRLEKQAAALLQNINKNLTVVCIAGRYRTGKSYLMNRLMGKSAGFALGNTLDSKTKGIWVWYKDHPLDKNRGFLVMDTEGLGDPMGKEDVHTFDMWILCLSILLSSTFVFNVMGVIDSSALDTLDFITSISKHIKIKAGSNTDADFDGFFPNFVLAIRDKYLDMVLDGKEVTDDEYMERAVLTCNENTQSRIEQARNETKKKLRRYFMIRKCFFFESPTKDKNKLKKLETVEEKDLDPEFIDKSDQFCSFIIKESPVKKLDQIKPVTGRIFVHLADLYLNAINNKNVPCIRSTVQLIAENENARVLQESVEKYATSMSTLQLPVEMKDFEEKHKESHQTAIEYFMRKIFLDEGDQYHQMLKEQLQNEYIEIAKKNIESSGKVCKALLNSLYEPIHSNIEKGVYLVNGGYEEYMKDLTAMREKYKFAPNKGTMAEKRLQGFLSEVRSDQNMILKADLMITDVNKQLECERLRLEDERLKADVERDKNHQLQQFEQNLNQAHEEQIRVLNETYLEKAREQQESFAKLLEEREEELRRLKKENSSEEACRLQKEIDDLKKKKEGFWKKAIRFTAETATLLAFVPHPVAKVAGGVSYVVANLLKLF